GHLSPASPGRLLVSGTATSFLPSGALRAGTLYHLSIARTAQSVTGVPLARPFSVTFTTGQGLRVRSFSPANGTKAVPAHGLISVTFNHPMVALAGSGNHGVNPAGWKVTIAPHI